MATAKKKVTCFAWEGTDVPLKAIISFAQKNPHLSCFNTYTRTDCEQIAFAETKKQVFDYLEWPDDDTLSAAQKAGDFCVVGMRDIFKIV
jgi:hypothetical protein